jgi:hypothetical protein
MHWTEAGHDTIGYILSRHLTGIQRCDSGGGGGGCCSCNKRGASRTHKAQLPRPLHSAFVSRSQSICFPLRRGRLCHARALSGTHAGRDIIRLVDHLNCATRRPGAHPVGDAKGFSENKWCRAMRDAERVSGRGGERKRLRAWEIAKIPSFTRSPVNYCTRVKGIILLIVED